MEHQPQEIRAEIKSTILPPPVLTLFTTPSNEFCAISELEPFPPPSRYMQGILGLVLERNMVRSKAHLTAQHTTIFSSPGMHEHKSPKAHHAEAIGPPALETEATKLSLPLLCIPDSLDQAMGQNMRAKTKTAPGGLQAGLP